MHAREIAIDLDCTDVKNKEFTKKLIPFIEITE